MIPARKMPAGLYMVTHGSILVRSGEKGETEVRKEMGDTLSLTEAEATIFCEAGVVERADERPAPSASPAPSQAQSRKLFPHAGGPRLWRGPLCFFSSRRIMKLWVMRHGHAGDASPDPLLERGRGLSAEGRQTVGVMAKELASRKKQPSIIVCSPFQRTVETAQIVGKVLGVNVQQHPQLQPQFPVSRLLRQMMKADERVFYRVLLIAHVDNLVPFLAYFSPQRAGVDSIAMAEIRRLNFDRSSFAWNEVDRILPVQLGRPMRY